MAFRIIMTAMIALFSGALYAQQLAKTPEGRIVILYENGTWKYGDENEEQDKPDKATLTSESTTTKQLIDGSTVFLDKTTERKTLIDGVSAKLKKYFKTKNRVRATFAIDAKSNKVQLKVNWRVLTGEASSYFGFINHKNSIVFTLENGQKVELKYNQTFAPKEFEKYSYSNYVTTLDINREQLNALSQHAIIKSTMNWSRRTEDYDVTNIRFFIENIPLLISRN